MKTDSGEACEPSPQHTSLNPLERDLLTLINDDGLLQSLLYDLDLLPEQIKPKTKQWQDMITILIHWRIVRMRAIQDKSAPVNTKEVPQ